MKRRAWVDVHNIGRKFASNASADRWPGWETVIGIEVHAQLKARRKLFSASLNTVDVPPNTHISLFDAAFPGTLPKLNRKCVELAIRASLALQATVNQRSTFDRKHYFYRDLPAGYQITQHYSALANKGLLRLEQFNRDVRITQIQLEQDTAKSSYSAVHKATQIDLNRAGVGLIEIVSEPDMRSPEEAAAYVRTLQALLRSVGASDGNMEQGSLRCDVNVSVNRIGEPFGTRCEIKNLNSIKSVQVAIACEVFRHIELLERGLEVPQETRGFHEDRGETYKLRSKEDAPDYRYMPDPNIPPLLIPPRMIETIQNQMPELPDETATRLQSQYGLRPRDVSVLMTVHSGSNIGYDGEVGPPGAVAYFEEVVKGRDAHVVVNWIINELVAQLSRRGDPFDQNPISPKDLGNIVDLLQSNQLTNTGAKTLIRHIFNLPSTIERPNIDALIDELGFRASANVDDTLHSLCQEAIDALPAEADLVRKGNDKVLMKIVGKVMKLSKGGADAKAARALLEELLSRGREPPT